MAIRNPFRSNFGSRENPVEFPDAYWRIIEVHARKMVFPDAGPSIDVPTGELDEAGLPIVVSTPTAGPALGARILTEIFADSGAAADPSAKPVGIVEDIIRVPVSAAGPLIGQAYGLLKSLPGREAAVDA